MTRLTKGFVFKQRSVRVLLLKDSSPLSFRLLKTAKKPCSIKYARKYVIRGKARVSSKYLIELREPLKQLAKGEMILTSYINKRGLAKNLKTTSNRLKIYSCIRPRIYV